MKTVEQRIRGEHDWHHRWLKETGPGVLRDAEADVWRYATEKTLPAVRMSTTPLSGFDTYYGVRGAARLVDGEPGAWDDIYLSTAFRLEFLRLRFALWTKLASEPGLDFEVPKIACALCFCLANGLPYWAQFLTNMLVQAETDDQMVSKVYWRERIFEPFALRLAQFSAKGDAGAPPDIEPLGVYSAVFKEWGSPERLSRALEAIYDYHCENMGLDDSEPNDDDDDGDEWDPEFDDPPCDLVPWEVLAIREVRARMGLATLLPAHPLLAPIDTFVPRSELPFDERLEAIVNLARRHYMTVELP